MFTRVVVESPYAGDVSKNMAYLRYCFSDCLRREEAPIASHKLYPDVPECDDDDPRSRDFGIRAGYAWGVFADRVVIYQDLGVSDGMNKAVSFYKGRNLPIEYRKLPKSMFEAFEREVNA